MLRGVTEYAALVGSWEIVLTTVLVVALGDGRYVTRGNLVQADCTGQVVQVGP